MGEQQIGQLKGRECFKNDKSTHIRRKITNWQYFMVPFLPLRGVREREGGYHQAINL